MVFNNAKVFHDACVLGNAQVFDDAMVFNKARILDRAKVFNNAKVFDDAYVFHDAKISEGAHVLGNTGVSGDAKVRSFAHILSNDHILCVYPIGSEDGTLTIYTTVDGIEVTRGCFWGTLKEFKQAVKREHGNNKHAQQYHLLIELAKLRFADYLSQLKVA